MFGFGIQKSSAAIYEVIRHMTTIRSLSRKCLERRGESAENGRRNCKRKLPNLQCLRNTLRELAQRRSWFSTTASDIHQIILLIFDHFLGNFEKCRPLFAQAYFSPLSSSLAGAVPRPCSLSKSLYDSKLYFPNHMNDVSNVICGWCK
jgi:hypothetical protein